MSLPLDILARVQELAARPGALLELKIPLRVERKLRDDGYRTRKVKPCPHCKHGDRAYGIRDLYADGVQYRVGVKVWVRRCCGRPYE